MLYHLLNLFGLVNKVFADSPGVSPSPAITNPLAGKADSIVGLLNVLLDIIIQIGIPVIAIFIVYSGFLFVKAQGNESKLSEAKQTLRYTVIGAAIVLGAKVISVVIETTIKSL
ncbi:MAG: hypothetical protein AAB415_02010 [Patescibacteria group bacterium]